VWHATWFVILKAIWMGRNRMVKGNGVEVIKGWKKGFCYPLAIWMMNPIACIGGIF